MANLVFRLLDSDEIERLRNLPIAQKRSTLAEVDSEIAPLARHDKPTKAQTDRIDELLEKRQLLDQEIRRDELREIVERGDSSFLERGHDGGTGRPERRDWTDVRFNRSAGGRPWEVRDWSNDGEVCGRALEALADAGDVTVGRIRGVFDSADDAARGEVSELARRIVAGADPDYTRAFGKMLRDPVLGHSKFTSSEWQAWERSAMSVGTNAQGGYMVPTQLDPTIILTNNGASAAMRALGREVTLTAGNVWHGVSSAGVTASFDAELSEVSDDSPNDIVQPTIPVYQAQAFVKYSVQADDDISTLAVEIGRLFSDAKDRIEEDKFSNGSGSAEPTGLWTKLNATGGSQLTSTTAATIGVVDIHALYKALPARYRRRGSWLMNPTYSLAIKALGTAVSATFSGDLTAPTTGRILGLPVEESDSAPTTQTTTALDNEIVIGDFSRFVIVDRIGMTVEFIPHLFSTSNARPIGARGLYARWRTGSDVVDTNAFRMLVDKTSA